MCSVNLFLFLVQATVTDSTHSSSSTYVPAVVILPVGTLLCAYCRVRTATVVSF